MIILRKKFWLSFFILFVSFIGFMGVSALALTHRSLPAPSINLKGKYVILNVWANWCTSCVQEIPELNHFYEHNKNKNVVIYGVNYDQLPPEQLKLAVKKLDIHFPLLTTSPYHFWQLGEITVVPMSFIISPDGQVIKKIVGPTTEASLQKLMLSLTHTIS